MKRLKFRYLFAVYAVVLSCVCMFWIYPAHDDFYYAAPKPGMNLLASLVPSKVYWRPFDRLVEYGLGYAPCLFPYVNHIIVIFSHLIFCAVLYIMLKKITHGRIFAFVGTLFFCLNTGIIYTVSNTDTMNQVLAMLAGFASVLFFFRAKTESRKLLYSGWLILAALSSLFKEEGIAWFVAPVLLYTVYEYAKGNDGIFTCLKRNYIFIAVGILGTLSYFAVRFSIAGSMELGGDSGRTVLKLSASTILTVIKNYCYIFAGAGTAIDSTAFFLMPRNYPILIITGLVSLMFLAFVFAGLSEIFRNKRKDFIVIIGLLVCAMYISSPYTVMARAAESQAYEMAFMLGLILGMILSSIRLNRKMFVAIAVMFLCMASVCCRKVSIMHEWTSEIRDFIDDHRADFNNTPSKIFVYYIEDVPLEGYSVYRYSLGHGLAYGRAFLMLWNWKPKIKIENVSSDSEAIFPSDKLTGYDTVFKLTQSGKFELLRN